MGMSGWELRLALIFPDWARHFTDGAADPGSPWRNLALGTVGLDGAPQVRTVVLRRFSGSALDVHTDTRSAKYAELRANPAATLHGWDAASSIQLRASGPARLHVGDGVAEESWAGLREQTRATYRVQPGPGTELKGPENPDADATDAEAKLVFCVIRLEIRKLDWLQLAKGGHQRARFTWAEGAVMAEWVVP